MQITREYRNELLNQAKPVQQYLYGSPFSGGTLLTIANKYQLNDISEYKKFAISIGDIILGFYKIEDTVPLLQQELGLDAKTAALLGADVLDFLAPLSDPNWKPPVEDEDGDLEDVESATSDLSKMEIIPETTSPQIEPPSTIIPQLRTMAADMVEVRSPVRSSFNAGIMLDEPTYTSTQPTLERKATEAPSYTAPLYEPPKPNVDAPLEKPRWG